MGIARRGEHFCGFKAGGFNPSLAALQGVAVLGPEFIPYQPEYLWNYELGLKGLGLNSALSRLTLTPRARTSCACALWRI